jgi:WD40 repeat protein
LRSATLSPDGALVATASSDGLVRVWDGETLELVHEIPLGDSPIEGVAFVGEHHLAVTPERGNLLVVTLDADELLEIVRESLTRGFSDTECARFGFGDECPTIAELRGNPDGVDDPGLLNGSYRVDWTTRDFNGMLRRAGVPMTANSRATRDVYHGSYIITIDDGRFDIVHDRLGAFCTGSYTVTGDTVRMVAERTEAEWGCAPGRFLDATFSVTGDALTLTAASGHPVDAVLFAGPPLTRVER